MTLETALPLLLAIALLALLVACVAAWLAWRQARTMAEERRALLAATEAQLRDSFAAVGAAALRDNTTQFLQLANEKLRDAQALTAAESEQRRQAVEQLVAPLREELGALRASLAQAELARAEMGAALRAQMEAVAVGHARLSTETSNLVRALRAPQGRGKWGELQLRRVVELAGMAEHCDFSEQVQVRDDGGRALRPDLVVSLPGGKQVVVDAKAPLQGYLDAMEATADTEVSQALDRHVMQVRAHVRTLGGKAYWDQFADAPDFVVMFLPGESFLGAALARDPALMDEALANRVLLASPTTLVALLKSAAYGWQQERLAASTARIRDVAAELVERLGTFSTHLTRVGEGLDAATRHYNRAVGSYEQRLLATARKFETLGVSGADEQALPAPAPVSQLIRGRVEPHAGEPAP